MITRLLIANRGEIARRIMGTCRSMGIGTVAVYSDADADAAFVREADVAVPIGGPAPADSYLRGEEILRAAKATGADAVHPGYGFLSENADFARAVIEAGLLWVGPPPEAIESMGSKIAAKQRMATADVPLLPSVELDDMEPADVASAVSSIGYPILIKASSGGGGRGMRVVRDEQELHETIESATREAASAFGDGTVYAEKFVAPSKHVEVQIFGDQSGSVVHFGERECSVQRRHQKVIEEAPSPSLDTATRAELHEAAVAAGHAIGYQNAGTVEFLLDPGGGFYFLEVNTRLQVEHPVTEAVHGVDLVRLQLEVAAGGSVPLQQDISPAIGHAIEARVYAEDPTNGYLPSVGAVSHFSVPDGIRVDAAFDDSGQVTAHYDAMIAKAIAHAPSRDEARRVLAKALRGSSLIGIEHNIALLVRTLEHSDFDGGGDTELLDRVGPDVLGRPLVEGRDLDAALLAAALAVQADHRRRTTVTPGVASGFRNVVTTPQEVEFSVGADAHVVGYRLSRGGLVSATVGDRELSDAKLFEADLDHVDLMVAGVRTVFGTQFVDNTVVVTSASGTLLAHRLRRFSEPTVDVATGSLVAAMPGTIRSVEVEVGDQVLVGQTVVVMEAMKMELAIEATTEGTVSSVHVTEGEAIDAGAPLIVIE